MHVKRGQVFVGSSTLGKYVNEGLREPSLGEESDASDNANAGYFEC